jgi:hypothetical protein
MAAEGCLKTPPRAGTLPIANDLMTKRDQVVNRARISPPAAVLRATVPRRKVVQMLGGEKQVQASG